MGNELVGNSETYTPINLEPFSNRNEPIDRPHFSNPKIN